jgi:hypothetical protein
MLLTDKVTNRKDGDVFRDILKVGKYKYKKEDFKSIDDRVEE